MEATYDGVLNGYGGLSDIDIAGSRKFITDYINNKSSQMGENNKQLLNRVLDCGAGIGRITK